MRVEALAGLGDSDRALDLADQGLQHWTMPQAPVQHAALCLLAERICENIPDFSRAFRYTQRGLEAAGAAGEGSLAASTSLALLRINRRWGVASRVQEDVLRTDLIRFASGMSSYERARAVSEVMSRFSPSREARRRLRASPSLTTLSASAAPGSRLGTLIDGWAAHRPGVCIRSDDPSPSSSLPARNAERPELASNQLGAFVIG